MPGDSACMYPSSPVSHKEVEGQHRDLFSPVPRRRHQALRMNLGEGKRLGSSRVLEGGSPQFWGGMVPLWPSSRAVPTTQPGREEAVFQPPPNGAEEPRPGCLQSALGPREPASDTPCRRPSSRLLSGSAEAARGLGRRRGSCSSFLDLHFVPSLRAGVSLA